MLRDLYSNIKAIAAIAPAVQSAAASGAAIDMKGNRSVAFIVNTGAIVSSGDFGISIEESDQSNAGFAAPDDAYLDGTVPATLEANSAYRLGYRGTKRYVRLSLAKAGGTSIALGAVAIVEPLDKPVV
jgi:hypothetical protein